MNKRMKEHMTEFVILFPAWRLRILLRLFTSHAGLKDIHCYYMIKLALTECELQEMTYILHGKMSDVCITLIAHPSGLEMTHMQTQLNDWDYIVINCV